MRSTFPDLEIPEVSFPEYIKPSLLKYGNDVALVDNSNGKYLTYKQLYDQINKLSFALTRIGLSKGDVVGLFTNNCVQYPVIVLAILSCGATIGPCRVVYSTEKVLKQFRTTEPRFLIVGNEFEDKLRKMAKQLPSVKEVLTISESPNSRSIDELIKSEEREDDFPQVEVNLETDVASISYSRGTTGTPKGVMFNHQIMVSNVAIWRYHSKQFRSSCCYTSCSFYQTYALQGFSMCALDGAKYVFDSEFNYESLLQAVEKYKVTVILGAIWEVTAFSKSDLDKNYDISSLVDIVCSGTVISWKLKQDIKKRLGCHVSEIYALTEFAPLAITHPLINASESAGMISVNTEVKIVEDLTGEEMPIGQVGAILAKGPQMMKGYFKNQKATENAIDQDGWFHTGDVGYLNEDGMLFVMGRKQELFRYKDTLIAPGELENVILQHPLILEAGVIGVPDEESGKLPRAYVVPTDPSLKEEEVIKFVQDNLPDEKHLRGGVEFIDKLPISSAGKITRDALLESKKQEERRKNLIFQEF